MVAQASSPLDEIENATDRRLEFAHRWLDEIARRKRGNPLSFGQSTLVIDWKKGEITEVTTNDGVSYR